MSNRADFIVAVVKILFIATKILLVISDREYQGRESKSEWIRDRPQPPPIYKNPPTIDVDNPTYAAPTALLVRPAEIADTATALALAPAPAPAPAPTTSVKLDWEMIDAEVYELNDFQRGQLYRVLETRRSGCTDYVSHSGEYACLYLCPEGRGRCCDSSGNCRAGPRKKRWCMCRAVNVDNQQGHPHRHNQVVYRRIERVWTDWMEKEKPLKYDDICYDDAGCQAKCPYGTRFECTNGRCMCKEDEQTTMDALVPLSTAYELFKDPCNPKKTRFINDCTAACPCNFGTGYCLTLDRLNHGDFCFCQVYARGQIDAGIREIVRYRVAKLRCACDDKINSDDCCANCKRHPPKYQKEDENPYPEAPVYKVEPTDLALRHVADNDGAQEF